MCALVIGVQTLALPLGCFLGLRCGQPAWPFLWDRRCPSLEGGGNGGVERLVVDRHGFGNRPQIVKVLHPAIGETERNHGLEFLGDDLCRRIRSDEHTSELPSLMRFSYAGFSLKKKRKAAHTI